MTRSEKATRIGEILDRMYPSPGIPLRHRDPFTLLVATVLSAQCTDKRVNEVSPRLFARAASPQKMARVPREEIEDIVRPCGLAPSKSRAISGLSAILVEEHGGVVPDSFEALEALPGVGHKTASVVMSQAFDRPAFPVDTHIHRLAARWGLSDGSSVKRTEFDLKRLFPQETWRDRHIQIILFGREHCPARGHDPGSCPICSWAGPRPRKHKERSR
jgi:endonuclease-3